MDTSFALMVVVYVFLNYSIVAENWNFSAIRLKQLRQERKLDAILKHLELNWRSEVDPTILKLIKTGTKMEAVKAYKELSGVALKGALAYIESFSERDS